MFRRPAFMVARPMWTGTRPRRRMTSGAGCVSKKSVGLSQARSSLILRAAAIYGPGRGVHAAIREGRIPRGAGSGIVSRIHVDDLAAILEAGLFSDIQGAWPVADEAPCSSAEIAAWCAQLLQIELTTEYENPGKPVTGRRVNGRKIRKILGVELRYPSWQAGVAACFAEEKTAGKKSAIQADLR